MILLAVSPVNRDYRPAYSPGGKLHPASLLSERALTQEKIEK